MDATSPSAIHGHPGTRGRSARRVGAAFIGVIWLGLAALAWGVFRSHRSSGP